MSNSDSEKPASKSRKIITLPDGQRVYEDLHNQTLEMLRRLPDVMRENIQREKEGRPSLVEEYEQRMRAERTKREAEEKKQQADRAKAAQLDPSLLIKKRKPKE